MCLFFMWRTIRKLDTKSTIPATPNLIEINNQMAHALDLPSIKVHVFDYDAMVPMTLKGLSRGMKALTR